MKFQFELTDTYGGEANYSWVKRTVVELPDGTSDKLLGMLAREWAGFTGKACKIENYGDALRIKPAGLCQILFVTDVLDTNKGITDKDVERWAIERRQALGTEYAHLVTPRERQLSAAVLARRFTNIQDVGAYFAHVGMQGLAIGAAYDKLAELDKDLPRGAELVVEVLDQQTFDESLDTDGDLAFGEEGMQVRALGGIVDVCWVWPDEPMFGPDVEIR